MSTEILENAPVEQLEDTDFIRSLKEAAGIRDTSPVVPTATTPAVSTGKTRSLALADHKGSDASWLAPEGEYVGRLVGFVDLGTCPTKFGDKEMINLIWRLNAKNSDGDYYEISHRCSFSWHPKSTLYKMVSKSDKDPDKVLDLKELLGCVVGLDIVHNETGERTYANVGGYCKPHGTPATADGYVPSEYHLKMATKAGGVERLYTAK